MQRPDFAGHLRGSRHYRRILLALACAGVATFAQLYSYQGVLPLVGRALDVGAAQAALTVSAATVGLAVSVLPWSFVADRIGRVRAMSIGVLIATALGLATPLAPTFTTLLALRVVEGMALGSIPALAIAYLSEEIHPRDAAVAAGSYVAGTTVGGLAGRIVAAPVAAAAGWQIGIVATSLLGAAAAVGFLILTPTPRGFSPAAGASRSAGWRKVTRPLADPVLLALFAQAFLLMGGFVAVYNYLTFRLELPPFGFSSALVSLIFLAYLSGTYSSKLAGRLAVRYGRLPLLLVSTAVMATGVLLTIGQSLVLVLIGLVLCTAGFFGAHSIASGWTGRRAAMDRAQAGALYNLSYYGGSSVFGWAVGLAFQSSGWTAAAVFITGLIVAAAIIAAVALRGSAGSASS